MSRLTARITAAFLTVIAYLRVVSARTVTGSPLSRSRRAATFIEYAILAAIAVAIGLIIQQFLAGSNGWIAHMLNLLSNQTLSSTTTG